MSKTYEENTSHEMFVFRVPLKLAEQAHQKAEEMMTSKSAMCRQALQEYVSTETAEGFPSKLPSF